MLWSLTKILLFVVVIAALTLGAGYLLESEGGVRIEVAGTEYTLTPLMSVIGLILLLVGLWVILKLLSLLVAVAKFVNGDETALSRYFDRSRERRGYQALTEGMMALASGEGKVAVDKARKAERLLRRPELTNLITAQAAEVSGDKRKAEDAYKRLLQDETTRFVGVRGLLKQKLADGKTDTALKLAETAFALKPRHTETSDLLLKLQAENQDWKGARKTLNAKLKNGTLQRDIHRRRDAVLALSEAKDLLAEESSIEQREAFIEANRLSPDLIPAAAMAARSYIKQNKARYATRVLKKAWDAKPHPDLAAAFADIVPDETPEARIKRFKALIKSTPDHEESRMLLAELYIAAEDFPEARRALGDLWESNPTARSLTIMAAIERGEGADDTLVKSWLAKAVTASRGPQWVCDNCQTITDSWEPVCGNCGALDTFSWRVPPQGESTMQTAAEMLPLIVGAIEDKTAASNLEDDLAEDIDSDETVPDAEVIPPVTVIETQEKNQ